MMNRNFTVEIDANRIENSTIMKLDRKEIGALGLVQAGVFTYKGELKSRVMGLKVTMRTENQVNFESDSIRYEVIKIIPQGEENEYAIRCYDKELESYDRNWMILTGCHFFR